MIKKIQAVLAALGIIKNERPSDKQIFADVEREVEALLTDWLDDHPGAVNPAQAAYGNVELMKACYACVSAAVEKYRLPDLEIGFTFRRDESGKFHALASVGYDTGDDGGKQLVTDWKTYSAPADKTFEAFKGWVMGTAEKFGLDMNTVSEEVWQRKWREFWENDEKEK